MYWKGTNVKNLFLRNIDRIAVKKIDEIEKEKRFLAKISLKVGVKRREVLREIKGFEKGKKRNYKMSLRNFSHGIMEHILQKKKCSTRNGT